MMEVMVNVQTQAVLSPGSSGTSGAFLAASTRHAVQTLLQKLHSPKWRNFSWHQKAWLGKWVNI